MACISLPPQGTTGERMFCKPTIAVPLTFCFTLATAAISAEAAFANLVRQYESTSPGGQAVVVCVYSLDGKEFERQYPQGNFCPARVEL